jgi:ring-1,2-phenylacetyl-CoA epoxidase subunit PaaE
MSALRFHELTVKRVNPEAAGSVAVTFDIPAGRARHLQLPAGPVPHPARQGRRPGTCAAPTRSAARAAAWPSAGELEIGIRPVEGGVFSNWAAQTLKAGSKLEVMPPDGRFTVKKQRAIHRVGFAAGSGITPILSIAASTLEEQPEAKFTLVYGNRRMSSVMFNEALQDLKDRYRDRLTLIHILSRQAQEVDLLQGRIDGDKVKAIVKALLPAASMDEVFICGPEAMIEATEKALIEAGVPESRVYTERFTSGPAQAAKIQADTDAAPQKQARQGHRPDHRSRRQAARTAHRRRRARARRRARCRPRPALLVQGRRLLHLPRQGAVRRSGDGQELHAGSRRNGPGLRAQLPGPGHHQADHRQLRRALISSCN